jgi:hypothetical protein
MLDRKNTREYTRPIEMWEHCSVIEDATPRLHTRRECALALESFQMNSFSV